MRVVIEFEVEMIGYEHDMTEVDQALRDSIRSTLATLAIRPGQAHIEFTHMDI